ncbi:dispersed gene family protein 1 (DGF-1), putative, partial [Trypanosoma cruzi]
MLGGGAVSIARCTAAGATLVSGLAITSGVVSVQCNRAGGRVLQSSGDYRMAGLPSVSVVPCDGCAAALACFDALTASFSDCACSCRAGGVGEACLPFDVPSARAGRRWRCAGLREWRDADGVGDGWRRACDGVLRLGGVQRADHCGGGPALDGCVCRRAERDAAPLRACGRCAAADWRPQREHGAPDAPRSRQHDERDVAGGHDCAAWRDAAALECAAGELNAARDGWRVVVRADDPWPCGIPVRPRACPGRRPASVDAVCHDALDAGVWRGSCAAILVERGLG